jgi:hypothetical protein
MMQANARSKKLVPRRENRIHPAAHQRPRRVCKALSKRWQWSSAFPKISTIPLGRKHMLSTKENFHATRASDLLRCSGRPPHLGSADARPKFQREFARNESNRRASIRFLPCLSAGGGRLVDATALSGDGFQGARPAPLRRKERHRRNAVNASRVFSVVVKSKVTKQSTLHGG